jgi:small nuclear ribonucleoprotein (snRNP)-like protein
MDKKMFVHLQGGRKVSGTLRGYDLFLNLVIDDAVEETTPAQKHPLGTVVSWLINWVNNIADDIVLRSCAVTA